MFRHRFFTWTPLQLLTYRAKYATPLVVKRYQARRPITPVRPTDDAARRSVIPPPPLGAWGNSAAFAGFAPDAASAAATATRGAAQDPAVAEQPLPASRLAMVCPNYFAVNDETFADNGFARRPFTESPAGRAKAASLVADAIAEHTALADALHRAGVEVSVFAGLPDCPDATFVADALSVHRAPHEPPAIVLYPMARASRRAELRRDDLLAWIRDQNPTARLVDLRGADPDAERPSYAPLEGTGSLVLDRRYRVAFAAISNRTYYAKLREFAERLGYRLIVFHATTDPHRARAPVCHTSAILAVGHAWAIVALEAIPADAERDAIVAHVAATGRALVAITLAQARAFCGNVLEVTNARGERFTVMSETARAAFAPEQLAQLGAVLAVPFKTLETYGGGGVRCCLAEI